jgi:hypothetical protein
LSHDGVGVLAVQSEGVDNDARGVGRRIRRASDDDPPVKKALLDGAADIFERGGSGRKPAEVDKDTVRDLQDEIGELAVANDFSSRKLKPWTGKLGAR